ncbi:MAG TPA: DUF2878 domain-containing protein [Thermoanaerobaculaceae bacterium]|nr:DUF2878 domain-containing protein [Thermoanaerobaculaceae bacterium]
MKQTLVNVALYEAGWIAAIMLASHGRFGWAAAVPLALTVVHVALSRQPGRELGLVVAAGLVGCGEDTLMIALRAYAPRGSGVLVALPPLWLIALWVQLATLVRFSLRWLAGHRLMAGLLGALGGPVAVLVGVQMGAAAFPHGAAHAVLLLAPAWALATPALFALGKALGGGELEGEYRFAR